MSSSVLQSALYQSPIMTFVIGILSLLALAAGGVQNETKTWQNKMVNMNQTSAESNESKVEAHLLASFSSAKGVKPENVSAIADESKSLGVPKAQPGNQSHTGNQSPRSGAVSGGSLCESFCTVLGYGWTHCWSGSCKCSDNFYEADSSWCSNGISGCKRICGLLGRGWAHCRSGRCFCNDHHYETSLSC